MRAFLCILTLAAGAAFADGVPLVTPGPALPAGHAALERLSKGHPEFVRFHPVQFNKNAFGANVLTVKIDGEEHRFVGSIVAPPPNFTQIKTSYEDSQTWSGTEGKTPETFGVLTLVRNTTTGNVSGLISLPGRRFQIVSPKDLGSTVLLEWTSDHAPRPRPAASGARQ